MTCIYNEGAAGTSLLDGHNVSISVCVTTHTQAVVMDTDSDLFMLLQLFHHTLFLSDLVESQVSKLTL